MEHRICGAAELTNQIVHSRVWFIRIFEHIHSDRTNVRECTIIQGRYQDLDNRFDQANFLRFKFIISIFDKLLSFLIPHRLRSQEERIEQTVRLTTGHIPIGHITNIVFHLFERVEVTFTVNNNRHLTHNNRHVR